MFVSLLLLLLVCGTLASHYYGTTMTFQKTNTNTDGSIEVSLRYKLNFHSCTGVDSWDCLSGDCGSESVELHVVQESSGEWCQREGIMDRQAPSNAPFQLLLSDGNWVSTVNNIILWRAVTLVDLRNRSDTGRPNRSPQTTILPALRIPSNCQRELRLLTFDPDKDVVRCRHGNTSESECDPCNPPSVLNLSSSCTLSFSTTNSSNEGPYAVQLVVEDFPTQNIILTQTDGSQEVKTTNNPISKLPLQFVLRVEAAVPSCTEGLYLPKFLPPTPEHNAQLNTPVNETLDIHIRAEANISTISELLYSGPHDVNNITVGDGEFILRWTPSEREERESHPVCFVVQAVSGSVKYQSDLRCVIISVGNSATHSTTTPAPGTSEQPSSAASSTSPLTSSPSENATLVTTNSDQTVAALRVRVSSSTPLSDEDITNTVIQQLKDELVRRGLPSDITLRLVNSVRVETTASAPP